MRSVLVGAAISLALSLPSFAYKANDGHREHTARHEKHFEAGRDLHAWREHKRDCERKPVIKPLPSPVAPVPSPVATQVAPKPIMAPTPVVIVPPPVIPVTIPVAPYITGPEKLEFDIPEGDNGRLCYWLKSHAFPSLECPAIN